MIVNKLIWIPSLVCSAAYAGQARQRPNILVFIADDLGTNEIGCYGGENLKTPNIDRLAQEGIQLTNNFCSMAVSVPIRASLYTGLYPQHHGSFRNHKSVNRGLRSVVHYMTDLGYRVGRAGKDHPVRQPKVFPFEKIPGFAVNCTASHPPVSTPYGIHEFISRDKSQPFCLFVCSINTHAPWDAGNASEFNPDSVHLPPNCVDNAVTRRMFCDYLAEIRMLDNEVGMTLRVLEETGQLDNTLVIFLGEQGPKMPYGKWTCYRYGQHSAFLARYPRKIKGGTVSDALAQYEDVLPTLIDFAGGAPIDTLDGRSLLPVLYGKKRTQVRKWAYGIHNNHPEGPAYPIRCIQDKRYRYILNLMPDRLYSEKHMMKPENPDDMWGSWLVTAETDQRAAWLIERFVHRPAQELYDHETDPWELHNLAELPEYATRVAEMKEAMLQWMERMGDTGIGMDVLE